MAPACDGLDSGLQHASEWTDTRIRGSFMLIHEQQVRLTRREQQVLLELTGRDPSAVRTREDLRRFAEANLAADEQDADTLNQLKAILSKYLLAL
ncbi:hypothetical protein EZI54_00440 [Marinobacter halodurans]|uniref:OmpR/PhoB-type domain-containing protein n=1 Tax=Marinobacter halodurans TaxID=2528979 RepID=A0ABY1ZSL6_9GAMM|nr:hypothetical protein [Marinobacter halodurans]TBW59462.1 hypothetical protein EZI54_00440 [Marinobacter halodurans]